MKKVWRMLGVAVLLFFSCKRNDVLPIKFKRPNKVYDLAIEGCLNSLNKTQFVRLTKPAILPGGNVEPISGAKVSIGNDKDEVFLSETNSPGVYSARIFNNKNYGRPYKLKVQYKKKEYFAIDTLVRMPDEPHDVPAEAKFLNNGMVQLKIPKHIFGAEKHIRWLIAYQGIEPWEPSDFTASFTYTYSDPFGPPNALYPSTQQIRSVILNPEDTVTVYKFSVSQSYSAYLYNLFQETDFKSIFSSGPGNIYGNVSQGAQGYFYCTDVLVTKYLAKELVK